MSIALIVLWMLSPLGGQSASRLLSITEVERYGTGSVAWHNAYVDRYDTGGNLVDPSRPNITSNVYVACMLQSRQSVLSPRDLWGNVKIPFLPVHGNTSDAVGRWTQIDDSRPVTYSSLTGITVAGLRPEQQSSFSVGSRYLRLEAFASNQTGAGEAAACKWFGKLPDFFSDPERACTAVKQKECAPQKILMSTQCDTTDLYFAIWIGGGYGPGWYLFKFHVIPVDVESHVECKGISCAVTRMRPLTNASEPNFGAIYTDLAFFARTAEDASNTPGKLYSVAASFNTLFKNAPEGPTNEAFYVTGFDPPYSAAVSLADIQHRGGNLTTEFIAERLSTLLNTYIQSESMGNMIATASDDTSLTPWKQYPTIKVTAKTSTTVTVYAMDPIYVSLTLTASFILLLCGFLGLFFRYNAVAPDIIGYVSTMMRDNKYFEHETGHGMLDGLERARLLRGLKVMIGEVRGEDGRGHVALRSVGEEEIEGRGRLKRWTEYT